MKDTEPKKQPDSGALRVFVTAQHAYPALEELVLGAEDEVIMSFRIFDPRMRLISAEARKIGKDWGDLIAHVVSRGVMVDITIADFDPVVATELHKGTWRSIRYLSDAREIGGGARSPLSAHAACHPAEGGVLPRIIFAPVMWKKLAQRKKWFDDLPAWEQDETPSLKERLKAKGLERIKLHPVTHHHKIAVIDRKKLYIGGLDLDERRYDTLRHSQAPDKTWHDVQVLVEDAEAAEEARAHIVDLTEMTGGRKPIPETKKLLRTMSVARGKREFWHLSPGKGTREILNAHMREIARAERFIYLETQFLRDTRLARALAKRGEENRDLELFIVLPAAPQEAAFRSGSPMEARFGDYLQARNLKMLMRAYGDRLLIASPAQMRSVSEDEVKGDRATLGGAPIIYVHSKVSLFDDRIGFVTSANLNGRSLRWDTEAGLRFENDEMKKIREAVLSAWLVHDAPPEALAPETAFKFWDELVWKNAKLRPEDRHGFLMPYGFGPALKDAVPIPGMPEEMV